MEIIEVESLSKLLYKSKIIGHGTTCLCFLLADNSVLKLYLETYNKKKFFSIHEDMIKHLTYLNSINNDTYIGPNKIYVKNGIVIGYGMEYKNAKTLSKIPFSTKLDQLIDAIPKLEIDTRIVSDENFGIFDVHSKNILFNNNYYVIDLDYGREEKDANLYSHNMQKIFKAIFESLYNIKPDEILKFYNQDINEVYLKAMYSDYKYFSDFYEIMKKYLNKEELVVYDIKRTRNGMTSKEYNNYYRY